MDYPRELNIIIRVLIRGRQEGQCQRRRCDRKSRGRDAIIAERRPRRGKKKKKKKGRKWVYSLQKESSLSTPDICPISLLRTSNVQRYKTKFVLF